MSTQTESPSAGTPAADDGAFVGNVVRDLEREGFAFRRLGGDVDADLALLAGTLDTIGTALHVFRRHPFWKALGTDPDRPPGRSGGTGLNDLHIDCVNTSIPPDIVVLYCVRPDPLGGGTNLIATLDELEVTLTPRTIHELMQRRFADGAVVDLDGVGVDENPFAVYDPAPGTWRWRYSARLLDHAPTQEAYAALRELHEALWHRARPIPLAAGDCLFVDQRTTLHGRLPLIGDQTTVPPDERRLLVQAYARCVGATR